MRNRNIFGDALKDLITRSEIKDFLGEVRSLKGQKGGYRGRVDHTRTHVGPFKG